MIEAIVSGVITLIVFSIGYGRVIEQIENLKINQKETDDEVDLMRGDMKIITDLRVDLAEIKKDIHYIKESLRENK